MVGQTADMFSYLVTFLSLHYPMIIPMLFILSFMFIYMGKPGYTQSVNATKFSFLAVRLVTKLCSGG